MKQCGTYTRLMMRYFDRTLGEEETATLLGHVGKCARCGERFDRLSALLGSLEKTPGAEPPASLDGAVMRAVRVLPVPAPAQAGMAPVFAAAGILLALAASLAVQGAGAADLALTAADALNGVAAGAWKTQLAADFIDGLFPGLAGSASRMFWNVVLASAVSSMLVGLRSAVAVLRKA